MVRGRSSLDRVHSGNKGAGGAAGAVSTRRYPAARDGQDFPLTEMYFETDDSVFRQLEITRQNALGPIKVSGAVVTFY